MTLPPPCRVLEDGGRRILDQFRKGLLADLNVVIGRVSSQKTENGTLWNNADSWCGDV